PCRADGARGQRLTVDHPPAALRERHEAPVTAFAVRVAKAGVPVLQAARLRELPFDAAAHLWHELPAVGDLAIWHDAFRIEQLGQPGDSTFARPSHRAQKVSADYESAFNYWHAVVSASRRPPGTVPLAT